jgi:hypothetical protein
VALIEEPRTAAVEANVLGLGGRECGKRGQCDVMIRMVDLIVVRGLNAGRVNG